MAENEHKWGLPLESHLNSYHPDLRYQELRDKSEEEHDRFIETAEFGVNQICELGQQEHLNPELAGQITLSTLQSVAMLECSRHTVHYLISPLVIRGCIKLALTVTQGNQATPFSYEYGYLAFRIMGVAAIVCLLKRSDKLPLTRQRMDVYRDEDIRYILNSDLSSVILGRLLYGTEGPDLDQMLGWGGGAPPAQDPILLDSDATLLLKMLWEDRKHLLEATVRTIMPGLTGLLFILWRFWRLKQVTNPVQADAILRQYSDVLWRYFCVIDDVEEQILSPIYMDIIVPAQKWFPQATGVDLEDSRRVIETYIGRIKPAKPGSVKVARFSRFVLLAAAQLNFVAPLVQHGTEDLFPSLFRATIESIWNDSEAIHSAADVQEFSLSMITIFKNFSHLLEDFSVPEAIQLPFIEATIDGNLIDLTAKLILMVEPLRADEIDSLEQDPSIITVSVLFKLYRILSEILPKHLVEKRFDETFFDWLSFRLHLLWRAEFTGASGPRHRNNELYSRLWDMVGKMMGHHHEARGARLITFNCGYTRCPDPAALLGARFTCVNCTKTYCSARCQGLDWVHCHGKNGRSHKSGCMRT